MINFITETKDLFRTWGTFFNPTGFNIYCLARL